MLLTSVQHLDNKNNENIVVSIIEIGTGDTLLYIWVHTSNTDDFPAEYPGPSEILQKIKLEVTHEDTFEITAFNAFFNIWFNSGGNKPDGSAAMLCLLSKDQKCFPLAVCDISHKSALAGMVQSVYYDYVGNIVQWSKMVEDPSIYDRFKTFQQVNGISSPCTLLMAVTNLTLSKKDIHYFYLQNAADIGGCLCYIKSANITGMKVVTEKKDDTFTTENYLIQALYKQSAEPYQSIYQDCLSGQPPYYIAWFHYDLDVQVKNYLDNLFSSPETMRNYVDTYFQKMTTGNLKKWIENHLDLIQ
jgi:hypothetical protein